MSKRVSPNDREDRALEALLTSAILGMKLVSGRERVDRKRYVVVRDLRPLGSFVLDRKVLARDVARFRKARA